MPLLTLQNGFRKEKWLFSFLFFLTLVFWSIFTGVGFYDRLKKNIKVGFYLVSIFFLEQKSINKETLKKDLRW